jgi:hypothetical protein
LNVAGYIRDSIIFNILRIHRKFRSAFNYDFHQSKAKCNLHGAQREIIFLPKKTHRVTEAYIKNYRIHGLRSSYGIINK